MHFIFPKNYNFKSKIFGIIDYSTAIIDLLLGILIFYLINFFFQNLTLKIYIFISLYFPIILFSILGINRESFLTVFIYMYKFLKNRRIYLYIKN